MSNGVVTVWSYAYVSELWSAYAPNFKELDENEVCEFDIVSGLVLGQCNQSCYGMV